MKKQDKRKFIKIELNSSYYDENSKRKSNGRFKKKKYWKVMPKPKGTIYRIPLFS